MIYIFSSIKIKVGKNQVLNTFLPILVFQYSPYGQPCGAVYSCNFELSAFQIYKECFCLLPELTGHNILACGLRIEHYLDISA